MNQNNEFSTTLAIENPLGWHMRPAGLLVSVANMFESEIMVKCGRRIASAKSLLGILTLGAGRGARLYVSARGRDAQLAIRAIREKFSSESKHPAQAASQAASGGVVSRDEGNTRKKEAHMKESSAVKKSKPKGHVTTTFKCGVSHNAKSVFLAGDFNDWNSQADPMIKRGGQFSKSVKLLPGRYQYKYVIDGEWHADPTAPLAVSELGSTNNIICV
ncbi:MAG: HPr family phosphocarrier protein [bacterium]